MKRKNIIIIVILGALALGLIIGARVNAADPEFMVSWSAKSYAPTWYKGKIFPTFGSRVDVNMELTDDGKIADLSRSAVRWYLNGNLVKNENDGLGIKTMTFFPKYGYDQDEIKISLPDYKGSVLTNIITIPVKQPEISAEAPYNNEVERGSNLFKIWPFFFKTSDLKNILFSWTLNGTKVDNPQNLSVFQLDVNRDTVSGTGMNLDAQAENIKNQFESAGKSLILRVK